MPPTRNELVASHLSLVRFVVDRIASTLPPHLDRDDLKSAAMVGLISAAERFEPSRGVQFRTFAEQRIRGSVMDELRTQDWLSRGLRGKFKTLDRELSHLEQRLGRNPSCDEIAQALGVSLEDYHQTLDDLNVFSPVSLDDNWHDEDGVPFGLLDVLEDKSAESPQSQLIAHQTVELLAELIDELPEKERLVITLYYYEELSQREIGAVLDLTVSRISQLHSQAVTNLRNKMKCVAGWEDLCEKHQEFDFRLAKVKKSPLASSTH